MVRVVGAVEGLPLTMEPGSFMAREYYTRPEIFDVEMTEIFPRSWVFVCDVAQVANPGDFVASTIGKEPVLVVCDGDGEVRAYSNVCSHRGCLLLENGGNCGRKIVCEYHGWSYALDGRLVGVSYKKGLMREADPKALGLTELKVGVWERFVFVNVSGDAPPLEEYLEDVPDLLSGHEIQEAHLLHTVDDEISANWKIFMDNAICDYHIPFIHRRLMRSHKDISDFSESAGTYTNVLRSRLNEETTSEWERWPGLKPEGRNRTLAIGIYPNVLLIGFVTGDVHLLYWTPLAIDRSRAMVLAYSHSTPAVDDFRFGVEGIEKLQAEDYRACELVQKGMQSRNYRPGPRHYLETRVNGFQEQYLAMVRDLVNEEQGASFELGPDQPTSIASSG